MQTAEVKWNFKFQRQIDCVALFVFPATPRNFNQIHIPCDSFFLLTRRHLNISGSYCDYQVLNYG